jgi:hypothetical protein
MIDKAKEILKSIIELLKNNNEQKLARYLTNLYLEDDIDPDQFMDSVKALFGGMGSLSDVVLSNNGRPLINENNTLDALRKKLYNVCSSYRYTRGH